MKIIIAGDFACKLRTLQIINNYQFESIFSKISPFIKAADISIVNYENPVLLDGKRYTTIAKNGPNLQSPPNAVKAIAYAGFNTATLANNHILDYGEDGCIDAISSLHSSDINPVGAGTNIFEAEKVLYRSFEDGTIAIINCCEHEFSIATENSAGANPPNPIKQFYSIQEAKKKADYVLVIVHGGHEYHQLPSPRMQETYRFFIDAGADAVVNHHQHCFSGYEIYKDRPIFYGLGNFCFDSNYRNSVWNEGYMAILDFTESGVSIDTVPYIQCNEKPGVFPIEDRSSFDKNYLN